MDFKKHICIIFIIGMIFCVFKNNSYADDYISFQHITIDNGLSQSTAEVIYQDSYGYVWIGTDDGLNRYNGFEIKVYKTDSAGKNSIVNNSILSIQEDDYKNLWIGTSKGISKIDLKTGDITNYEKDDKGNYYYDVRSILITNKGTVILVASDDIYIYDKESDKFNTMVKKGAIFKDEDVVVVREDKNNNLWVGTNKSLIKIDKTTSVQERYISKDGIKENDKNAMENNRINSILIDDDDNIWIATKNNGLQKLCINKDGSKKLISFYHDKNDDSSIPSNTANSMIQDNDGTIWIATDRGMCKYLGDGKFYTYLNKSYDDNSLMNDNVNSLMQDSSGLIWVGTYTGVSIFDPTNKIMKYKNDPLDKNSLSDNVIHGIYEDYEGLLWIGTRDKGLNIFDRKNNEYKRIYSDEDEYGLTDNSVRVIEGYKDTIWVGTTYGLNQIDKKTMKIKKYTLNEGLVSNNIRSLLYDSKGYLWIGSSEGLDILDVKNEKIIGLTSYLEKAGLSDIHIEDIYEDEENIYWLANFTLGALIRIDSNKDELKIYNTFDTNKSEELSGILCISDGGGGNLWLGTREGLLKFNKSNESFTRYTDKDGLANNMVYGILIDDDGNPWMSTNNGISKFYIETGEFSNLSSTDGLQNSEFNSKASYKTKSGEFIFGGIGGLNIFYPEDILESSYVPEVTFESFEINGKLYKDINKMKLNHNENFIRIKYFIPEYKMNSNTQFYYKIDDSSDDWILVNNNEIILNELPPGDYTFRIKPRSQNGNMGKESKVTFSINPPIWKSKGMVFLYLIAIIYIVYRNDLKVKKLDNLVDMRTKALSAEMEKNSRLLNKVIEAERNKNNYFINLSHELRTPLNVISSVQQLVTTLNKSNNGISREKIDEYMIVMNKNIKRLLNLINNIIDTTKIENGKYKLNLKEEDIVYLVEETALSLKDAIESNGIDIVIDTDVEEKNVVCDKVEIERCILNLLSNAAKFTPEGGVIKVDINDLDDKVKITVEDTGIGIDSKYHKAIFDRFNQVVDENTEVKGGSGLGLTITKHIIDLHGGDIYVESEKNKGTKFTIILPIEYNM